MIAGLRSAPFYGNSPLQASWNYSLVHSVDVYVFGGQEGFANHVFWLTKLGRQR